MICFRMFYNIRGVIMSKTLSLNIEIKDESGAVNKKEELISFEINNPKHIKDLGLSHAEQIEILKKIIDNILPEQINLMEKIEKCPSCLNKTNKQGSFGSRFSSVFTDGVLGALERKLSV